MKRTKMSKFYQSINLFRGSVKSDGNQEKTSNGGSMTKRNPKNGIE